MSPVNRRNFLKGSLAGAAAGGAGVGIGVAASSGRSSPALSPKLQAQNTLVRSLETRLPFEGEHQNGILTDQQDQMTMLALDSIASDRAHLLESLQNLSNVSRSLTSGYTVGLQVADDPAADSGILGPLVTPDNLTITIAFGASLFDDRFGLANVKPRRLREMPNFANDDIDPARAGGDVLVKVAANHRDTVVHAVREIMRALPGQLTPRWSLDGFTTAQRGPTPRSHKRNLFAFRDGTANPDLTDAALMNQLVWVQPNSGEPEWATGGTYQVVRTIRMHVEFWDRVGLLEQENMIGRYRDSGAPLGGTNEFEDPDYPSDPTGYRIKMSAHIRLANPRTPATADQRIVRRGFNYNRGLDEAGNQDQGLLFIAFNQDIDRQFATIQKRLDAEPMVDYITPVGGGYFFAPRGAASDADFVGSGLARV